MTHKELYNLLKTINLPVAYDHFDSNKDITPPFIVYRDISPSTFKADNKTYYRPHEYEIELVTDIKNPALEKQIEELLDNNNIPYDIDNENWDNNEKIYHNFYII